MRVSFPGEPDVLELVLALLLGTVQRRRCRAPSAPLACCSTAQRLNPAAMGAAGN